MGKIVNVQVIENVKDMETVLKSAMNAASLSANLMQNASVWAIRQTFHGNVTPCRKIITAMNEHKMYRKYVNVMIEFMVEYGNVAVDEENQTLNYAKLDKVEPSRSKGESWRTWNEHVQKARILSPLIVSDEVKALIKSIKSRQSAMDKSVINVNLLPDLNDAVINALNEVIKVAEKAAA